MTIQKVKFNENKQRALYSFTFFIGREKGAAITNSKNIEIVNVSTLPDRLREDGFNITDVVKAKDKSTNNVVRLENIIRIESLNELLNDYESSNIICNITSETSYRELSAYLYDKMVGLIVNTKLSNIRVLKRVNHFKRFFDIMDSIANGEKKPEDFLPMVDNGKNKVLNNIDTIYKEIRLLDFSLYKKQLFYFISKQLMNYTDEILNNNIQSFCVGKIELYLFFSGNNIEIIRTYTDGKYGTVFYEKDIKKQYNENELFFTKEEINNYRIKYAKELFEKHKKLFLKSMHLQSILKHF